MAVLRPSLHHLATLLEQALMVAKDIAVDDMPDIPPLAPKVIAGLAGQGAKERQSSRLAVVRKAHYIPY
jgi:hypothetical protein